MESFYLTLSSNLSSNEAQQPGDFSVDLSDELDFRGGWEVGLASMQYTGQGFENINSALTSVTVSAKPGVTYQNDYIVTWDKAYNLHMIIWRKKKMFGAGQPIDGRDEILNEFWPTMPQQHYSWAAFKQQMQKTFADYVTGSYLRFAENDTCVELVTEYDPTISDIYLQVEFGREIRDVLYMYLLPSGVRDDPTTIVSFNIRRPANIVDSSKVVLTPYNTWPDSSITVGNKQIIVLTKQFWTLEMISAALRFACKDLKANRANLEYNTEKGKWYFENIARNALFSETITFENQGVFARFISSETYKKVSVLTNHTFTFSIHDIEPYISAEMVRQEETARGSLMHNYYPSVNALVNELNLVTMKLVDEVSARLNIETPLVPPFTCDANGVVSFGKLERYNIMLHSELTKYLFFSVGDSGFLHTQKGQQPAKLKQFTRSSFYVHIDCIERYQFVNQYASDIIRKVSNNATIDETVTVDFVDIQYHQVARRYVSRINMFVTEHPLRGILNFHNDIEYTIHFRKCHAAAASLL
jgi:hypothetical protein